MKNYKIAVAGTGYVGLSIATLLSRHHHVTAVDIIPEKVEMINNRKSPIQDDCIEKYLAEKDLNLTATLDAKVAYSDADFDCWMIGSVSPAMHKYIWVPGFWVVWHKLKSLFMKKPYSMYENKIVRDYRDGKVTKEELDKCSTCDMNCVINNGLSEASKEQLKYKTGEEIVDADIAGQMEKR